MWKTKRRLELERKEEELIVLKARIQEMKHWCAADSGEIAFAMLQLENTRIDISCFRDKLRKGEYTFANYKNLLLVKPLLTTEYKA